MIKTILKRIKAQSYGKTIQKAQLSGLNLSHIFLLHFFP